MILHNSIIVVSVDNQYFWDIFSLDSLFVFKLARPWCLLTGKLSQEGNLSIQYQHHPMFVLCHCHKFTNCLQMLIIIISVWKMNLNLRIYPFISCYNLWLLWNCSEDLKLTLWFLAVFLRSKLSLYWTRYTSLLGRETKSVMILSKNKLFYFIGLVQIDMFPWL